MNIFTERNIPGEFAFTHGLVKMLLQVTVFVNIHLYSSSFRVFQSAVPGGLVVTRILGRTRELLVLPATSCPLAQHPDTLPSSGKTSSQPTTWVPAPTNLSFPWATTSFCFRLLVKQNKQNFFSPVVTQSNSHLNQK